MINRVIKETEIRSTIFEMGQGGQAKRVSIVETTNGCVHLYKEYREDLAVDRVQLEAIAAWPAGLVDEDRAWLDAHAAWISHVVENEQGNVVGVLLPIARESFWYQKGSRPSPREGSKLLQRRVPKPDAEIFPRPHLYVFLARLLENIMWFHNRGVVLGDLQLPNLLVGESEGSITPLLIDMDAVWIGGESAVGMVQNTLYAAPGFSGDHLTLETDLYKFALIACKVLGQDNGVISTEDCRDQISPAQRAILDRMLACDSANPVNGNDLLTLVNEWSSCVGFERASVFTYSADNPVQYSESYDLILNRTQAPAVDFCSKDAAPTANDTRTDIAPSTSQSTLKQPVVSPAPDFVGKPAPVTPVAPPQQRRSGGLTAVVVGLLAVILVGGLGLWYVMNQDEPDDGTATPVVGEAPRTPSQMRIGASTGYVDAFAWDDETYFDIGGAEEPTISGFSDAITDDDVKAAVCGNEDGTYRSSGGDGSMTVSLPVVPDQYTYVTFCLEDTDGIADWAVTIVDADETDESCAGPKTWTQLGTPRDGAVTAGLQIDRRCVLDEELSLQIVPKNSAARVWGVSLWQGDYQYGEAPVQQTEGVPVGTEAPPQ